MNTMKRLFRRGVDASPRNFDEEKFKKNMKKRKLTSLLVLFIILPLLLYVFFFVFKQEHYVLMSLLILFAIMMPFFYVFEYRSVKARDVVLIATMTSFTVVANVICTHTVPLHAGTAMVVITGVALGPEAGFLTGALGRLICNVFDGQGPWTPWQMVAWGIMGLFAGIAFNRVDLKSKSLFEESIAKKTSSFKVILGPLSCIFIAEFLGILIFALNGDKKGFLGLWVYIFGFTGLVSGVIIQRAKLTADVLSLTLFTFFVTFIVYGGLLNFANVLMMNAINPVENEISKEAFLAVYLSGLPYDLQHAAGASAVMFFIGESMLNKVERVRIKFGILNISGS
ncbi:MAG: ECF transporter S component [Lachnospiraceae bacterium]|nr:ECF transporter S component [Lachnospiraceae bacterium]